MRFRIEGVVAAEPAKVMRVYHDRIETIAERLDEIARVEVLERSADLTRMRWYGKGDIPRAFHKVISPEDIFWEDQILWNFEDNQVAVDVRRPGLKKVRSESRISFDAQEGGTKYRVDGELRIEVPLFGPMLERFFVSRVEDNMRRFFDLLAQEAARPDLPPEGSPE